MKDVESRAHPLDGRCERSGAQTGRSLRWILAWSAIALLLSLARHAPLAGRVFDRGIADSNGSRFAAAVQRGYAHHGFWALRGEPLLTPLPGRAHEDRGEPYYNHPPLFHWLERAAVCLFGRGEAGLRVLPILCTALVAALLAWLAGRNAGAPGAAAAALLFASLPMATIMGCSPDFESPTLLACLIAVLLTKKIASQSGGIRRRHLVTLGSVWTVCAMLEWPAAFVALGAVLGLGLHTRARLPLGAAVLLGTGIGFAIDLALVVWWSGSFAEAMQRLTFAYDTTARVSGPLAALAAQPTFFVTMHGWPVGLAAGIALTWTCLRALRRRVGSSALAEQMRCWGVAYLLYVLAFPDRAISHESWSYYFLPAATLAIAIPGGRLWQRGRRWTASLILLACCIAGWTESRAYFATQAALPREAAAWLHGHGYGGETLLISAAHLHREYHYLEPWTVDRRSAPAFRIQALETFCAGDYALDRVLVLTRPGGGPDHRTLRERAAELGLEEIHRGLFVLQEGRVAALPARPDRR